MRILFDHNVPRKLSKRLKGHLVTTAARMGWAEVANGQLIENAEAAGFDLFLTDDQGIRYQQNHAKRRIPILLITSTHWPDVDASATLIVEALVNVDRAALRSCRSREKTKGHIRRLRWKTDIRWGGSDID